MPHKKTVLVTGAAGSLAKRVIARLHGKHNVIAVDFRRKVETDAGVPSYKVDMQKRGFEDIFRNHKIDAVIHIGRIFAHESDRQRRYNANVLGTKRLLELCRKYSVSEVVIHSTYFVYGASAYNPALLDEDAPLKASEVTQDLVDSVEVESLAQIYLWKYPELNITILRPCNVLGPGVRNSMSLLLSRSVAPVLLGFSPLMQFLHVDDMADALVLAFEQNKPGIYNVAPDDWVAYQVAVEQCGCRKLPVMSVPPVLPKLISNALNWNAFFPPYLINYFKYPVIIDGRLFRETFDWKPRRNMNDIFSYYRKAKLLAA
ncbi:SDR family oxidoreductase [Sinimarinibacterium sp. CAU 1509]|uniref:SDR family oxidoreductase n=1 Tax=Sinimarinibacterium sp. CAU 1509 TaxID=2562283 RepID=UPI0010AD0546|nr:SDR family oxidoreductase [Sinimarinibacterium sp. CAU 1509]TJY64764.1 SDR family oxidoreductase [Sinimarinibacterium sp. CAU 1509]